MKIDVSRKLVGFDGEVLRQNIQKRKEDGTFEVKQEEMVLRSIFENALLVESPQKPVPPTEKVSRMELARRIHRTKREVILSVEEAAKLKNLVLELYSPLVAGLTANILDGKEDVEMKDSIEEAKVEDK